MGTRVRLAADAPAREAGLALLDRALRVLEDTEQELSTWRDDSVISGLNRHPLGRRWPAPEPTCSLLRKVFAWHAETGGTFDPALGLRLSSFSLDEQRCEVTRLKDAALDVGGFGKGEALDRVEAALGAGPWLVDLGGQVSVGGLHKDGNPWTVDIAHPVKRDVPFAHVNLRDGSLSSSGNSERGDHIIDPRTGQPPAYRGSVTAWHRSSLVADIITTALYVKGPEEGVRWAEARGIAALYLVPNSDGVTTIATSAWKRLPAACCRLPATSPE
jgi:thiamine biosynthesis lipoprotein